MISCIWVLLTSSLPEACFSTRLNEFSSVILDNKYKLTGFVKYFHLSNNSDIDFQNNTITIRHTVTSCNLDGKHIQIAQDTTKTKSSMRTLPLVPAFKEKLLKLKEQQEEYKRVCGRCYNKKYLEYICVDEMGTLISPHYLTSSFPKLLEKNNLRHIRFHDLRHSCASLLLANGVPMKQIQEWLGHSDFSTTANVYAHLDYNSKLSSADAMVNGLSGALEVIS